MGRGRKPISNFNGSEWQTVFYNSVGTYVQYINIELSKDYKLEPLSNHLKIVGGFAFKAAEYKSQGIPIIRISDFNNEQVVLDNVMFYQESKDLNKYELEKGDIIIALTGGTIAKLAIVQEGLGKIYLNQRVGKFQVLNPEEFETEYIYWIARSVQSIIKNLAWGAAIPNVSPKQIEELQFPFPTKDAQSGIIDFLNDLKNNKIDDGRVYFNSKVEKDIISLHERQITTTEISAELTHQLSLVKKLRQQLLQDAVQGKLVEQSRSLSGKKDEPASELLKRIKAEKEQLIKAGKLKKEKELPIIKDEEIPFEIPENWVWCRGELIANYIDPQPSHRTPIESSDGIPYIAMSDIRKDGSLNFTSARKVSNMTLIEHQNRYKLKEGDFIFGKIGTIGKPVKLPSPYYYTLSANIILIQPKRDIINHDYLFYFLCSPTAEKNLIDNKSTMSYPVFGMGKARNMPIPLPPIKEQKRIVQKIEELLLYCNELEESIKKSTSQNEKLLQQVLREALREETIKS